VPVLLPGSGAFGWLQRGRTQAPLKRSRRTRRATPRQRLRVQKSTPKAMKRGASEQGGRRKQRFTS